MPDSVMPSPTVTLTSSDAFKDGIRHLQLNIPALREHLHDALELIHAFGGEVGWNTELSTQIQLVLEELLVNIIDYGYPNRPPGSIQLIVEIFPDHVTMSLDDDGVAFDPFEYSEPDLTLPLEERPIGGLGIHLVRAIMDAHSYQFSNGRNRTIVSKKI